MKKIKEAITKSKAKIIFIINLMTKAGQTTNYTAKDFFKDISFYIGREPDYMISHNGPIPELILDWYASHSEQPVVNDLTAENFKGTIIEEDVINRNHIQQSSVDSLTRSILRHDTDKLTNLLMKII